MEEIEGILEGVYNSPELRASIVPLFIGNPGLGKTKIIEKFADSKGAKLVEFITSQRNPYEISGIAMPDKEVKKMSIWDFDAMLSLNDGDILFFDEVLNGNPTVLNACLTLIEQRIMISGKKLPKIMIVAAANPQGMVPLTPQIKERFVWYPTKFSRVMWKNFMKKKYKMPYSISSLLCELIENEDFKSQRTDNFFTPRSIDKAVNMIIHGVKTPYEDHLMPILVRPIDNKLKGSIDLGDGNELKEGEVIPWIQLLKLKLKNNGETSK